MFKRLLGHLGLNANPLPNKRWRWDEIQKNTIELSDLSRSLTAREAYEKVEPRVRAYDQAARLTAITSGEDINPTGYSDRWELVFVLTEGWAQIIFSFRLELVEDAATGVEREERRLIERITPFPHPHNPLADMLRDGTVMEQAVADLWAKQLEDDPALPIPFQDSPDVVALFIEQGEDFVSGDIHLLLFSSWATDGQAVWRSIAYGVDYRAPFAAQP